jgi:integrase
VMLAFETGLRRTELCGLRTDDLDFAGKLLLVRADIAKDSPEYAVPYSDVASELLHRYLEHRQTLTTSPGPLFLSDSQGTVGKPVTVRMWSNLVRQIALQVELPRFTTRTFRRAREVFFHREFHLRRFQTP